MCVFYPLGLKHAHGDDDHVRVLPTKNGDYTMSAVHGIKKKPHQTQRPRRCQATSRPKITRPRAQKRPMTFDSEDEDEDEDELVPINKTAALIAAGLQPKKKASKKK
jgi:hypothetical protein